MNNIMLDIETLDTLPTAALISIAAVKFEFNSDDVETFYQNVSFKDCISLGCTTSKETVYWWKSQPPEVLKSSMVNAKPLRESLEAFNSFIGTSPNTVFWANGSTFDFPILENAYRLTDVKFRGNAYPWKYWNCRDARTVYSLFNINMKEYPRVGQYHNALDDCLTQIKALKECLVGVDE